MWEDNIELVKRLADAWNRDDLAAFLDLCDPDIEWHTSIEPYFEGTESVFRGHDGMRKFWEAYRGQAFERLEVRHDEFREVGEYLLTSGEIKVIGQASQLELTSELAQLWTFRGAKIIGSRDFLSRADALEAAGL
jgi:ketosteroid isomerase-like protein